MFNDLTSPAAYLASRRSARPRDMGAPGPSDAQLHAIVSDALRTPDHGKLAPWRVVHVGLQQRDLLSQKLVKAYLDANPQAGRLELEAMEMFAHHAPELLVVLFSPRENSKIPLWEQEMSVGAFCMNLLHAAHVRAFVGGWITGWPAYDDGVRDLFGQAPEKLAGFLYLGTAHEQLEERPRPHLDTVFSEWNMKT